MFVVQKLVWCTSYNDYIWVELFETNDYEQAYAACYNTDDLNSAEEVAIRILHVSKVDDFKS